MLFLKIVLVIVPLVNVDAADSFIGNSRNWNANRVSQPIHAIPKPQPKPTVLQPVTVVNEELTALEANAPTVSENSGIQQTRFNLLPRTRPTNAWENAKVTTEPELQQESWTLSTLPEQTLQPEQRETTEKVFNVPKTLSRRTFLMPRHLPQPNQIHTMSLLKTPAPLVNTERSKLVRPLPALTRIENLVLQTSAPTPEFSASVPSVTLASIAPVTKNDYLENTYEEPKQNNILVLNNEPLSESTISGESANPLVPVVLSTTKLLPPSRIWFNSRSPIRPAINPEVQKITEATSLRPELTTEVTTPIQTTVILEVVPNKEPELEPSVSVDIPSLPEEIIREPDPELEQESKITEDQEIDKHEKQDQEIDENEETALLINQEPEKETSIVEQDPQVINVEIIKKPSVGNLIPGTEWNKQEGVPITRSELSIEPQYVNEQKSAIPSALTGQRFYRPLPKLPTPYPVKPIGTKRPLPIPKPLPPQVKIPSKDRPSFVPKSQIIPELLPKPDDINPPQLFDYECREKNGYYGVQNDCDSYVECRNYLAFMFICPDGLRFNSNTAYPDYPCSYTWEVQCDANAIQRAPQPTSECPRRYGYFPVQDNDCSKYVICQEGIASLMNCPPGLVFNSKENACDWPENVPTCRPNVFLGFTCPAVSEDDEDITTKYRRGDSCRDYVACRRGQPRLLSCDPGLAFDEESQVCVDADYVTNSFLRFKCPAAPLDANGQPISAVIHYKYEGNCYAFFSCELGHARLLMCDPGFAFNPLVGRCVDADQAKC